MGGISGTLLLAAAAAQSAGSYVTPAVPLSNAQKIKILGTGDPGPAPAGAIELGFGYDATTNKILPNHCVRSGAKGDHDVPASGFPAGIATKAITSVSDMKSNQETSSTSAGFGFTYSAFSLGADFGSTSSTYFNKVDAYGRVLVRIGTAGSTTQDAVWGRDNKGVSYGAKLAANRANFLRLCGTHYVRAIYKGFSLDQTYRFALQQSASGSTSSAGLSFGVAKLFNLDFSTAQGQTDVGSVSSMTHVEESRGIIPIPAVHDDNTSELKALLTYANRDFATAVVAAKPEQARPIAIELVAYRDTDLPHSDLLPAWADTIYQEIDRQGGRYWTFLSLYGDLDRAFHLGDDVGNLYKVTAKEVLDKRKIASKMRTDFRDASSLCVKHLDDKAEPSSASLTSDCVTKMEAILSDDALDSLRLTVKS